eukprot:2762688-Pleurochrysis_carterae.AAC.1
MRSRRRQRASERAHARWRTGATAQLALDPRAWAHLYSGMKKPSAQSVWITQTVQVPPRWQE